MINRRAWDRLNKESIFALWNNWLFRLTFLQPTSKDPRGWVCGVSETRVWTEWILVGWPRRRKVSRGQQPLSVKRLFVLVQAWLCIHSWGLHFLKKNTPTTTLSCQKSPPQETFPCHFHPTLSTARCLPNFPPPCVVFSKGTSLRLHKGPREGVGSNREPDARGWGTEKGLRYSV